MRCQFTTDKWGHDTKWCEIINGAFILSYGLQAIQPGTSQWRVLVEVYGGGFAWAGAMLFVGMLSIVFAYSHHHRCRFWVAMMALCIWSAVVVLFSAANVAGPPMYNGAILMAVAVRVMIGAVVHEKQDTQIRHSLGA